MSLYALLYVPLEIVTVGVIILEDHYRWYSELRIVEYV